jgi:hypothetical protein
MEILIEKSKLAEQDVQEQQDKAVERHEKEKAKYDNGDDK